MSSIADGEGTDQSDQSDIFFLVLLYGAWTVGARWIRHISSGYPRSMFWASIGKKKKQKKKHNFSLLLFLFFYHVSSRERSQYNTY